MSPLPASPRRTPIWVWFAGAFGSVILLLSLAFVVLYSLYAPAIKPGTDIWSVNKTVTISFADPSGVIFATKGAAYGDRVSVKDMPSYLPAAFLVAEDRRFYRHWGVDLRGITRALFANLDAGEVVQGGSTITQQLAKNIFLKPERTFSRKVEELFIAFWLERHYDKDDILTAYLNRIYLGSGAYGVDAAARQYFGKSAKDVTLAEAAMLASLTRAPSRFSPEADLEAAQTRAAFVLDLLAQDGKITAEEAKKAKEKPAKLVIRDDIDSENYFADFALEQLNRMGLVDTSDLIVRTTLNRRLQAEAQRAVTKVLEKESKRRKVEQGALVSMEPDGAVRALVGGRSYNESPFNRAFQAQRQPGSAFKPLVYLAALEKGLTPDDVRDDTPYEDRGWSPANSDGDYRGPITLREALARSVNTVAVRIADEVGRTAIIEIAQRVGITSPLEPNRSLPLGTSEVNLLEITRAYATFPANGAQVEPYVILDVKTKDGKVLYQRTETDRRVLFSRTKAEEMNQMLFEVVQTGTGKNADMGQRPAAGKTGTTQDFRDAWFVGYTADYITGVWVGNDDNSPTKKVSGGNVPATIWKSYMVAAHKGLPVRAISGIEMYRDPEGDYYALRRPPPDWQPPAPPAEGHSEEPGMVERFFDELFGEEPYPQDPMPPPPAGPYRQPEPQGDWGY